MAEDRKFGPVGQKLFVGPDPLVRKEMLHVVRKFECRKDTHYKTQTGTSCEKCNSKAFRLEIESASSGLLDQCSTTELQKPLPPTWARVQYI